MPKVINFKKYKRDGIVEEFDPEIIDWNCPGWWIGMMNEMTAQEQKDIIAWGKTIKGSLKDDL